MSKANQDNSIKGLFLERQTHIFLAIIVGIVLLGVATVYYFNSPSSSESDGAKVNVTPTVNSAAPGEDFTITIGESDVDLTNKKIVKNKEYNLIFYKHPASTCQAVRSIDLGYTIDLIGNPTNSPIRFPNAGEYNFTCIGSNVKFRLDVK